MPQPDRPESRGGRPSAGSVLLLVALLVIAAAAIRGADGEAGEESAGEATAAASLTPAHPVAPVSVIDRGTLTVPQETRIARGTFWARGGETYLVTMGLTSTKPADSAGRSMYLGVTLSCSPRSGGRGISIGGTQNLLTGAESGYRNQGLIRVPEDGAVDCSIKASAPYDDVASAGTTFGIDGTWGVEAVGDPSVQAPTDVLPRTLPAGAEETVLVVDLPAGPGGAADVRALTSLHLTTCTGLGGSREAGRVWCSPDGVDPAGSTTGLLLRADLVGEDGAVCAALGEIGTPPEHIDLYRHHRLLSLELDALVPEEPCGARIRVGVEVQNRGPAPLVVHAANSSLVVVEEPGR
ncbi:hypothetical protein [Brachybacterium hainanense]|uniref:Uncharacterized protein n=1 Tax=Brachybacterium hainanense TaxID=1541174 RepID=A0ABV6RG58_9MICO